MFVAALAHFFPPICRGFSIYAAYKDAGAMCAGFTNLIWFGLLRFAACAPFIFFTVDDDCKRERPILGFSRTHTHIHTMRGTGDNRRYLFPASRSPLSLIPLTLGTIPTLHDDAFFKAVNTMHSLHKHNGYRAYALSRSLSLRFFT